MPHRRPVQLEPSLYVGFHRILLTMCTFRRAPLFTDTRTADSVRAELLRTSHSYGVEVVVYCFMPDHLHVLVEGIAADAHLLNSAKMFRQRSGHSYRALTGR